MEEHMGVNDGHTISGAGSGAVGFINESMETRKVGKFVRQMLSELGYKVSNCTVDYANSSNEALNLIVNLANNKDLTFFISIHFNASGGRGVEVYTYEGRQFEDAVNVCRNISNLGFINRGVKSGTGLYVIRKTKAKSMLIEVCFVDSADAQHYLKVGAYAIAKAIVEGITGKKVVEKIKFPMPLKMKYDCPAVRINGTSIELIKYFYKNDNITASGELEDKYLLNINGVNGYVYKSATTNR
jgi:hypothetical protein